MRGPSCSRGYWAIANIDATIGDAPGVEAFSDLSMATIGDVCEPGATVLWFGPDPREQLPVLFLRLRKAILENGVKLVEVSTTESALTPLAQLSVRYQPGDVERAATEIVSGLSEGCLRPAKLRELREIIGSEPIIAFGRCDLAESPALVRSALGLLSQLDQARFVQLARQSNATGAALAGLGPAIGPDELRDHWPALPNTPGADSYGILTDAAAGDVDVLVLLGSDPLRDFADRDLVRRGFAEIDTVVSIGTHATQSVRASDIILPTAGYAEVEGTTTNFEGRVSAVSTRVPAPGTAMDPWMVASELATRCGESLGFNSMAELCEEMLAITPAWAAVAAELSQEDLSAEGVPLDLSAVSGWYGRDLATPPEPSPEGSGLLRLSVQRKLYDLGGLADRCPSMDSSLTNAAFRINPGDADALGLTGSETVRVNGQRGSVSAALELDDGVAVGTLVAGANVSGADGFELIDSSLAYSLVSVIAEEPR